MKKQIIYIMGCGRSGSTILGYCLGNAANAVDLGEVLDYGPRKGLPSEFRIRQESLKFWNSVTSRLAEQTDWIGIEEFTKLQKRLDNHYVLIPLLYFPYLLIPFGLKKYRKALKLIYQSIISSSPHQFYIDSSKYPSRLVHLNSLSPTLRLFTIYLVRDPSAVIDSFASPMQGPKSFFPATAYYSVVNFFSILALQRTCKTAKCRVVYERLLEYPEAQLTEIATLIGLDIKPVLEKINNSEPLSRGFLMNGNRMSRQQEVFLKNSTLKSSNRSRLEHLTIFTLRNLFYR
ncbi:sulfotransferase [Thiocapsa imhoffii]|uniref:sulfotransferase n=1 Tax=Thiocapsa imhoffii TaxID=382777 RepID=UPI0019042049